MDHVSLYDQLNKNNGLASIFNFVQFNESPNTISQHSYRSRKLKLNDLVKDSGENWQEVYSKDKALLNKLSSGDASERYTNFFFTQKYGSRIEPEKVDLEGVSFFDNLRINEALKSSSEYLLVKGDLIGIQDFIYSDIDKGEAGGSRKTSQKLRGKSFFVSLLSEVLADYLLQCLGLDKWNLLFAGGGHFNVLLPKDKENDLDKWIEIVNLSLAQQLERKLNLVVASVACGEDIAGSAGQYFEKVNQERESQKYQQHINYLSDLFIESRLERQTSERKRIDDDFIEAGKILPKIDYLLQVFHTEALQEDKRRADKNLREIIYLGNPVNDDFPQMSIFAVQSLDFLENYLIQKEDAIQAANLLRLNDTDFLHPLAEFPSLSSKLGFGFLFIGKFAPTNDRNEVLDFEELAQAGSSEYKRLAAFRLDVDNLGAIFGIGLGEQSSLKQVAALSREMILFFSGHFNQLAEEHQLYIVYSGGDDAFVVGAWTNVMDFARQLHQDFKKFTCRNPNLHFSGGIFQCNPHYPIARFAEDAHNLETAAKRESKEKNRLFVFNHILTWEKYEDEMRFATKLANYLEYDDKIKRPKQLAKSFFNTVLRTIQEGFHQRDDGENTRGQLIPKTFFRNIGRLHYLFARHGFTDKKLALAKDDFTREIIQFMMKKFEAQDTTAMKDMTVALNYVLLKVRKSKK
ncbi:MAG: hypothetical protein AAF849_13095 [Bacteroidota bacterium]